jgi:RimJ/RimL family protein N-acetyltransferase
LRLAFDVLALDEISLALFADNDRAQRLYDRLGFVEDGALPARQKDGVERPVKRMVLTRARYGGGNS